MRGIGHSLSIDLVSLYWHVTTGIRKSHVESLWTSPKREPKRAINDKSNVVRAKVMMRSPITQ